MSVICAACLTENRASAMFCLGCAGKLPAFAATGPSALEAMNAPPVPRSSGARTNAAPRPASVLLPTESPGLMLRVGLVALATGLAFVVWYAYVTRKVPMSVADKARVVDAMPAGPAAAANPPATSPAPLAPLAPLQPVPLQPVPLASSLSAGETPVASGPAPDPPPLMTQVAPPERAPPPRATEPSRVTAVDPRRGCENLNFVFAARCEATNCGKPEYTRHPRCDAVREQRQRDDARRNPTLGY